MRANLHCAERDHMITENFLSAFSAESFFVYCSHGTEAGTKELIRRLLAAGKKVLVPKLCGKEMFAAPLTGMLKKDAYGILEPVTGTDVPAEICVTPLLDVDGEGYRLGYGGGYYDRYFATHTDILRVGFCYAGQAVSKLPRGGFDLPLHAIVTEEGVTRYVKNLTSHH